MGGFEARCECGKTAFHVLTKAVQATADIEDIVVTPNQVRETVTFLLDMFGPQPDYEAQLAVLNTEAEAADARQRQRVRASVDRADERIPDLYFMHCPATGLVKIGVAINVERRQKQVSFASGFPVDVVHTIERGGYAMEAELHRRYSAYREVGEWFRLEGKLADYLRPHITIAV